MRIDTRLKVRQVAGENIVMMQAEGVADMTQVVALNESAMELYDQLKGKDFAQDDVVKALMDTYDVEESTARTDAAQWVEQMRKQKLIID